jgi:ribosomal protein L37AE/L43A
MLNEMRSNSEKSLIRHRNASVANERFKGVMIGMQKKNREDCEHRSIHRVLDYWVCDNCGVEFKPKNQIHKNKRN